MGWGLACMRACWRVGVLVVALVVGAVGVKSIGSLFSGRAHISTRIPCRPLGTFEDGLCSGRSSYATPAQYIQDCQ